MLCALSIFHRVLEYEYEDEEMYAVRVHILD